MHRYRISGLTVASEIALPGAWPLDCGTPDVVIRQGSVAPTLADPAISTMHWEANEACFLLRAVGTASILIERGDTITFEPEAGAPAAACAAYLQGTAMGILLNQRGGIVLHAGAVAVNGRAMLFCGDSGEGKSTLVAALSMLGYPALSDDVSLITFDADAQPFVSADARQLKLSDEAIRATRLEARRGDAIPLRGAKSYVTAPLQSCTGELPLGAIYLLRSVAAAPDRIVRLDTANAIQQVGRNAHRARTLRRMGQSARYFAAGVKMIRHANVYTLERQRCISRLSDTAAMLERHWNCP